VRRRGLGAGPRVRIGAGAGGRGSRGGEGVGFSGRPWLSGVPHRLSSTISSILPLPLLVNNL